LWKVLASATIARYPNADRKSKCSLLLKKQACSCDKPAVVHRRDLHEEQAVLGALLQITTVGRVVEMCFPGLRISGHLLDSQRAQTAAPAGKQQRLLETSANFVTDKQ
jgi:hypothetical protein